MAQVEDGLQTFSTTRFERQDIRKAPLAKLVGELLDWIGGPIDLEALVNVTAVLRGVRDHPTESLDDEAKGYLETRVSGTDDQRLHTSDAG